ncbi:hypothetical protein E2P81_ATG00831 [Venturia nashicola]|uniref:DUF7357 domain-containing protein n=1 Tax=Venturia nashicola TaxID=86259 RepID=A0A4Z1PQG7_9PEZI|nr:hypothetical protein E6O75_ATG00848 [Venturia nashicola]TLD38288.1 hypothetical protein E2P81_ATG00831 [Venturia nashicola]
MRIRLCVRRNGLPDANLLWPAVEQVNGSKQKIADLLTAVNETMPLESLDWTLEDYVVEIAGFECLHWQFLGHVLKDEDQVTIRPMEQVEVRARQLSGRHQISSAGFHLVDGVPFGTRPLRPLSRPSVVIPPRKRRRISTDETDAFPIGSIEPGAQLSIANVDNEEQQLALLNSGNATLREESADVSDERPNKRAKTNKTVHFDHLDENEDDDEDDGDFNDLKDDSNSNSSSESESDTDESSSDSDSSEGEAPSEESLHQEQETWEGIDDAPARPRDSAPPHMGLNTTKARNKRRRESKRLAHLTRTGVLPQSSTLGDLHIFLTENERSFRPGLQPLHQPVAEVAEPSQVSTPAQKSKSAKLVESRSSSDDSSDDSSSSNSSSDSDDSSSDDSDDSNQDAVSGEAAPQSNGTTSAAPANGDFGEHMGLNRAAALCSGTTGPEICPENEAATAFVQTPQDKHSASYIISGTSESRISGPTTTEKSSSALEAIARRQLAVESAPKRARLNLDGAKRVIFGNLGQRRPKTKEDEERVRARLAEMGKAKKVVETKEVEKEVEPESEAWRSKIKVSACECIDGGNIVLSEPPYPFVQRWDPQQRYQAKKKLRNKNKKGKSYDADHEGEYEVDYYEGDGYDYDDSILVNYDEEDASVIQADTTSTEQGEVDDDLPSLPADISSLPKADLEDLKPGTMITFKHVEMGKNFMPEMTHYKTAVVESTADLGKVEKGFLLLKLARRDVKQREEKKFDAKGKRMYEKFEMPMGDEEENSDEEADEGILETNFGELIDARILRMVRVSESDTVAESESVDDAAARQLLVEAEKAEEM